MKKMRYVYVVPEDFITEILQRVDGKQYCISEEAWEVIKTHWKNKTCDGVRVLESGNDTLIITISKKTKEEMSEEEGS